VWAGGAQRSSQPNSPRSDPFYPISTAQSGGFCPLSHQPLEASVVDRAMGSTKVEVHGAKWKEVLFPLGPLFPSSRRNPPYKPTEPPFPKRFRLLKTSLLSSSCRRSIMALFPSFLSLSLPGKQ